MWIYKTRLFARWAKKEGLHDPALCRAMREMMQGLYDADLGGNLFKKRIARDGGGKRSGFRTIVATNRQDRWFFLHGFAKSEQPNIDEDEGKALKKLAQVFLKMPAASLIKAERAGEIVEVNCDGEK